MMPHEVQQHNQTVLHGLQPGDLLEFDRGLINHWAVYIGNAEVVHFLGVCSGSDKNHQCITCVVSTCTGLVCRDTFWDAVGRSIVNRNNSKDNQFTPFIRREIVRRALSTEGREFKYNIAVNNCEHFATWCRYGIEESAQVNRVLTRLGVGWLFSWGAALRDWLFGRRK